MRAIVLDTICYFEGHDSFFFLSMIHMQPSLEYRVVPINMKVLGTGFIGIYVLLVSVYPIHES